MRLKDFLNKLISYASVFKALISDSIWHYKGKSAIILISEFVGIAFQIQAIGVTLYYARAIATGQMISHFGFEFDPRTSLGLLALVSLATLLSLLFSAFLIFYSGSCLIKLTRKYEEFCLTRVLVLFGSSLNIWAPSNQHFCDDTIITLVARRDARYCAITVRILLSIIVPFITFAIASVTLLYINVHMTFFVFLLMVIVMGFYYKESRLSVRFSTLQETTARKASSELRHIIQRINNTPISQPVKKSWLENDFLQFGTMKQNLDAYNWRFKSIENSKLISNLFFAITFFIIMFIFGYSIIRGGEGWGRLIVYLLALRYMLGHLRSISIQMTRISYFFMQVKRYFDFLKNTEIQAIGKEKVPAQYTIAVEKNPVKDSLRQRDVHSGHRIGLIIPVDLSRYTIAYVTDSMLGNSHEAVRYALSSMWFVTSRFGCPPGTLRDSLGFPASYSSEDFTNEMEDAGLLDMLKKQFPRGLETSVLPDEWEKLDTDLKFALALLTAVYADSQWVMIEEKGLRSLSVTAREYFQERLSGRIMVIVYNNDLSAVGSYNEDVFVVIDASKTIGIGSADWIRKNESTISDIVKQSTAPASLRGRMDDDKDDDLDDEM